MEYVIIPVLVKEDERLEAGAKLLYGDILSFSRLNGFCYAKSSVLSKKNGVSERTIRRWISELKKLGYIRIEEIRDERVVISRKIYPLYEPLKSYGQKSPV